VVVSFIGGGNRSNPKKTLASRKSAYMYDSTSIINIQHCYQIYNVQITDKVFVFRLENEVSPLSFVALVPDGSHYTLPDSSQIDDHGESSQSFVALV
jgi:hypothetical protein